MVNSVRRQLDAVDELVQVELQCTDPVQAKERWSRAVDDDHLVNRGRDCRVSPVMCTHHEQSVVCHRNTSVLGLTDGSSANSALRQSSTATIVLSVPVSSSKCNLRPLTVRGTVVESVRGRAR